MRLFIDSFHLYMYKSGDQKSSWTGALKLSLNQSLIFALAIFIQKFNKYFKFRREILRNKIKMTFYRIKGIATLRLLLKDTEMIFCRSSFHKKYIYIRIHRLLVRHLN